MARTHEEAECEHYFAPSCASSSVISILKTDGSGQDFGPLCDAICFVLVHDGTADMFIFSFANVIPGFPPSSDLRPGIKLWTLPKMWEAKCVEESWGKWDGFVFCPEGIELERDQQRLYKATN